MTQPSFPILSTRKEQAAFGRTHCAELHDENLPIPIWDSQTAHTVLTPIVANRADRPIHDGCDHPNRRPRPWREPDCCEPQSACRSQMAEQNEAIRAADHQR